MTHPPTRIFPDVLALRRGLAHGVLIGALAWVGATPTAHAQAVLAPALLGETVYQSDPHEDVRKLLRQGQFSEALPLVERGVARNPRDPQMRFWQGYLLEQLGRAQAAQPIYQALIEEYPELPEPYNNLGVLLAAQGEYALARQMFEQALRANPRYAVASENLGDVLLQLARQAYERAQTIAPDTPALARKIQWLQSAPLTANRP